MILLEVKWSDCISGVFGKNNVNGTVCTVNPKRVMFLYNTLFRGINKT